MASTATIHELIEAEPEEVGISSRRLRALSRKAQSYIDEQRLAGAITMVARRGKVVHLETFGNQDDEAGIPMSPHTIFRIYSMTKPIVSIALMMLYEEGHFHLNDPVSKHVPEFRGLKVFAGGTAESYETRDPAREMTVRDVLTHMSGISSPPFGPAMPMTEVGKLYREAGVPGIGTKGTLHDTIVKLGSLPLQVDPGVEWIYGCSTDVVAYLCEVFSGQPLDKLLEERIFGPLGMSDTSFYLPPAKMDRFAACYQPSPDGGYVLSDAPATSEFANTDNTYFSGVGGLLSTAPDYMRFAKMLANRGELDGVGIIGPRTLQLVGMNHLPGGVDRADISQSFVPGIPQLRGTGFGLGFAVLRDPAEAQILGTPGEIYWSGAASTHFFVSPADELAVVFMTQLRGFGPPSSLPNDLRVATYQALLD
jgi:CubicO group peptidase (beta-lactamase class C family)